jgi:hypothetical protein
MTPKLAVQIVKPSLERRPRIVTAIVGFVQSDGVVMGADSEETAQFKRSAYKIPQFRNQRHEFLVVGGAGAAYMIETITQRLKTCFQSIRHNSPADLFSSFDAAIREFYLEDVLKWPTREERENNDFSLLLGLAVKIGSAPTESAEFGYYLWVAQSGILRDAGRSFAIGSGAEYALLYLDNLRGLHSQSLETATFAAIHVLSKVKRTQPYCGNKTYVWIVAKGIALQVFEWNVQRLEELSSRYDLACDKLFLATFSEPSKPLDEQIFSDFHALRDEYRKTLEKQFPEGKFPIWK